MNKFRYFLFLSFAILTLSFVNVSAQNVSGAKSAKTLEQKVFKEIIKLPRYGVFDHIAFKIDGDTVTLFGKVNNATNRSSAKRVVEDIPGVGKVINEIEVLPPSPSDDRIRRQLIREFASSGGLYRYLWEPNPSVRIIVDRGRVELEGYVSNRMDANLMNILANGVFGVFEVKNNLIVGKGEV